MAFSLRFSRRLLQFKHNKNCFRRGIQYTRDELPDERDIEDRMNLQLLSQDKGDILCIQKYSNNGFTLSNGLKLRGPMAFFPRSFINWRVSSIRDVNENSLSLFLMLTPKPDLFLLGIGSSEEKIDHDVIRLLRERQINFEILPTDKAIATFNFLCSEHRWIAAGLIPPRNLVSEDRKEMEALMEQKRRQLDYLSDDEEEQYEKIDGPTAEELPERNLFGYEIAKSPLEKFHVPIPKNFWMYTEQMSEDLTGVARKGPGSHTSIGEGSEGVTDKVVGSIEGTGVEQSGETSKKTDSKADNDITKNDNKK